MADLKVDGVEYLPVAERLGDAKMEKKLKKVIKEGGKRGVEIEGAADMGGLQFFCTAVEEPAGDLDLLYESVRAMNAPSDPTEEERKGGSGKIGKMVVSISDEQMAVVAYVPPDKVAACSEAEVWLKDVLMKLGGGEAIRDSEHIARANVKKDADKGLFPLKMKDSVVFHAIDYLKKRQLFPDKDDDEEDEMVFGDDDFPSE